MIFSNSILPTSGAYYELRNASITNGILNIEANGYAVYHVTKQSLKSLTEYFRVSILANKWLNRYEPSLYMYLRAKLTDGSYYSCTITPTGDAGKVFTEEVKFKDGDYTEFTCKIYSVHPISIQLYELCPIAADAAVEVEINGVRQALDRLLYDYNTDPIMVDTTETTIGLITFNLRGDTDLQGHLEVSYIASNDCVVTIRAYDVGVEELYTPIIYDIKAGRGNIALPHSYLKRLSGFHTTYITAQTSTGSLVIGTRGLLYTIDGGYLADRLIDSGMSVLDITVEQPEGETRPTNLWAIGIDANNCLVKSRSYYADTSEPFVTQYSLGNAITAAIEFNGDWSLRVKDEATRYTIITKEAPYAFWIDTANNLYCQQGEDENTRFLVDDHVTTVSACRGFSSSIYADQDQGLIVLYVKNGIATYRNFCRTSTGSFTWQGPFTIDIPDEHVINVAVHRLNDYRLGMCISTATHNYWYITERTYINQAVPVEIVYADYNIACPTVAVFPANYTYDPLSAMAVLSDDKKRVIITFNYPIRSYTTVTIGNFSSSVSFIEDISITGEKELVVSLVDKAPLGTIIKYTAHDSILQFSPLVDRWVPATDFTVIAPGITQQETIDVTYSEVSATITQDGKKTKGLEASETLTVKYGSVEASIQAQAIITKNLSAAAETFSVAYDTLAANIEQVQTGTKPI